MDGSFCRHKTGWKNVDLSLLSLVLANVLTIFLALYESWHLFTIIFIYWFQSVTIGFFTVVRILTLKIGDYEDISLGIQKNGNSENPAFIKEREFSHVKIFLAGFFTLHYGLFHYGYWEFIGHSIDFSDSGILWPCIIFFLNHLFSHVYNTRYKKFNENNFGDLMFKPYLRIIPIHTTIVFGVFAFALLGFFDINAESPMIVFFLLLKTYSDVEMHGKKHRIES